jgi:L-iditol 2-dehydrogenase
MGGKLADLVIVCTGSLSAVKQALESVDKGGTILFFAPTAPEVKITINLCNLWSRQVNIATSYAAAPNDLKEALKLIQEKKVNVKDMITHRLPLEETGKGFSLTANPKDSLKVIIEPWK